jgi:hypothetical protein
VLGWRNERVAASLHLSVATVKFHLSRIYEKLRVESRSELLAHFSQAGAEISADGPVSAQRPGELAKSLAKV